MTDFHKTVETGVDPCVIVHVVRTFYLITFILLNVIHIQDFLLPQIKTYLEHDIGITDSIIYTLKLYFYTCFPNLATWSVSMYNSYKPELVTCKQVV